VRDYEHTPDQDSYVRVGSPATANNSLARSIRAHEVAVPRGLD